MLKLVIMTCLFVMACLMGVIALTLGIEGEAIRSHVNLRFIVQLSAMSAVTMIVAWAWVASRRD